MLPTSIGTVRGKMLPGVTPSVSVFVPCYNGGRFIPQLLGSLARQTFREHFDSANTTHDGHLTLDQAKSAKWTAVVRRFDKMDADHKGYVTAQDIYNEFARERAEKAKATGTAPSASAGSKS